jgi:hypothetical protein
VPHYGVLDMDSEGLDNATGAGVGRLRQTGYHLVTVGAIFLVAGGIFYGISRVFRGRKLPVLFVVREGEAGGGGGGGGGDSPCCECDKCRKRRGESSLESGASVN